MSRKLCSIVTVIGVILGIYFLNESKLSSSKKEELKNPSIVKAPAITPDRPTITILPIAADVSLNSPAHSADDDLATIELLLSDFNKHQGGNPVGENEEITAALLGKNPRHLAYLPASGNFLNPKGQLIDRWGTPYFFHQLSAKQTEIRSAGPDKQMDSADDFVR